jgi:hypothetical protein
MPSPPGDGQGSAPPEVSPAAETPGLEATPARGSLTGPHDGRIRGQPSQEGPAGWSTGTLRLCPNSRIRLNGVFTPPASTHYTPGLSAGLNAQRQVPGAPSWPRERVAEAASPQASLARNRRVALFMFTVALGFGIAVGVAVGVVIGVLAGVVAGLAGLLFCSRRAAWPQYAIAKTWLALRRRLPWQLMDFLADAHERGILQQAGTVYQHRHIELQHWLVARQ